jgi:hypothetical protein
MIEFPVQLNDRWRVTIDANQWILEVRKGRKRAKASGWQGRSYCFWRTALFRCIRDYCGPVDPTALEVLNQFPETRRLLAPDQFKTVTDNQCTDDRAEPRDSAPQPQPDPPRNISGTLKQFINGGGQP